MHVSCVPPFPRNASMLHKQAYQECSAVMSVPTSSWLKPAIGKNLRKGWCLGKVKLFIQHRLCLATCNICICAIQLPICCKEGVLVSTAAFAGASCASAAAAAAAAVLGRVCGSYLRA
eukprot:scaffold118946_cov24-Tisochrysis_lutea.AAC.1